jgi:EAL domain-containing protein (putative c-di-GMP-specific phosphodiesterase class I)
LPPVSVAVNLSARQFHDPAIAERVRAHVQQSGLAPALLELEITESVIMKDAPQLVERLRALNELGVRFAIDDFGTGYSSLSYLRRFPIQTLKIDRSFIADLDGGREGAEIVKTILTMARGLRMRVVAEGVETAEQLAFLRAQGCDSAQGYHLARPMPPEEAARLMGSGRVLRG